MENLRTTNDEIFLSESEFLNIRLKDIIDVEAVQSMMDDFFELTNIGIGIIDLKGEVLVATGWQDICTQFHRVNPESCQHCLESDTILSSPDDKKSYKTYKCRNNMWDMSTPIEIGKRHMGNLFLGQFFYDDEEIDLAFFKKQAHKYGFEEEEYLEALNRVPRFSRNKLDVVMRFYTKFAQQISSLGYNNLEHKYSIKKQEVLKNSIEESEKKYRKLFNTMFEGVVYQNAEGKITEANPAAEEILGLSQDQLLGRTSIDPRWKSIRQDGSDFPGNEHPSIVSLQTGQQVHNVIMGIFHPDKNRHRWIVIDAVPEFRENESKPFQVYTTFRDITEYKELEFKLNEKIEELDRYFNSSLDLLCIANTSGEFIRLNPEWEKVLGYSVSEMEGKQFFDFIHPDDIDSTKEVSSRLENQEEVLSFKNRYRCKDGSYKWIEWRSKPLGNKLYAVAHDVTEKKKSEDLLLKSRKNLKEAQQMASLGNWEWDIKTNRFECSEEVATIFGFNMQDFTYNADYLLNFVHPEDKEYYIKTLQEGVAHKKTTPFDYRIIRGDGKVRHIHAKGEFILYENGVPTLGAGILQDITDRKLVEEQLKKNEETFRAIADYTASWEAWFNPEGKLIWMNPYSKEISGYTPEEFMAVENFLGFIFADEDMEYVSQNFIKALNGESGQNLEARINRKDGVQIWISVSWQPIYDSNGTSLGFRTSATEITERKLTEVALSKSEEKYRLIANNTSDGIFVLSAENIITYVSPAYMNLMGMDADAHVGADSAFIYEIIHHEDRDDLFKMIYDAISKNVSELKYEFRVKHANGHYFWREDNARFVYDEKGKYGGTYVVCRDITERKNAEEKLKTNETKLRELNLTKDKFFSIIAHDLRSPFSSIINLSDMLMEAIKAKESFDELGLYAENLSYSSKRAYELLVNLLEWSRSQTGQMQFSPYILGLKSEVAESMELYIDVAKQKSISFEHTIPSRTLVYADKPMLQTILRNLISNAIKFTQPGGHVLINAESTSNEVIVSIKDTGIGIEKEMIKELFILGKDTGRPGTNDEPSTGLGLVLCHDFIEKHGGKIWAESEEGKGSLFRFSIPISPDRKV
jgi:PAS domain S-box-containing protein